MKSKTVTAPVVTDLAQLPVVLNIRDMSAVCRLKPDTIRRQIKAHLFHPRPFANYPYRWRKPDVIAHFEQLAAARPDDDDTPPRPAAGKTDDDRF